MSFSWKYSLTTRLKYFFLSSHKINDPVASLEKKSFNFFSLVAMSKNSLQRIFWSHIWKSVIIKMFKMSSLKTEAWATRKQLTPSILSLLTFNRKYFKPVFQTRASRLCVDYLKRELMAIDKEFYLKSISQFTKAGRFPV